MNHHHEFLLARVLLHTLYNCEDVGGKWYFRARESLQAQAQLDIEAGCNKMPLVVRVVAQIEHAQINYLHHASEAIVVVSAIRLKLRRSISEISSEELEIIWVSWRINIPLYHIIVGPVIQRRRWQVESQDFVDILLHCNNLLRGEATICSIAKVRNSRTYDLFLLACYH